MKVNRHEGQFLVISEPGWLEERSFEEKESLKRQHPALSIHPELHRTPRENCLKREIFGQTLETNNYFVLHESVKQQR